MIPLYKNKDDIKYIDIKMLNYNICLEENGRNKSEEDYIYFQEPI